MFLCPFSIESFLKANPIYKVSIKKKCMLWKSKFKKHRIQQGHRSPSIGILTLCLVFLNLTH